SSDLVATTVEEALAAIDDCFEGEFGEAGAAVLVEEFLVGEEASFFCLCDGTTGLAFGTSQDHKRIGENDTGPNTGGMGAYSPAGLVDDAMRRRIVDEIARPSVEAIAAEGMDFRGVLYIGLMLTPRGPRVLEFNTRFGDPETQVLLPRLATDPVRLMLAATHGRLHEVP